ncbi:MAG TPA: GDSL-type esterase/lipase family protein [bacterium]
MSTAQCGPKRALSARLAAGLVMAVLIGFGGCGGDSGPDFGDNDPELIVAIGDSITFGYGDIGVTDCVPAYRTLGGYPPRLAALTNKHVINAGVCGEDSFGGVDRVQRLLDRWHPGVLLIDYSPNDVINGTHALLANLRTMALAAKRNKTVPVLGTMTPATGEHGAWMHFIEAGNDGIRALCNELDIRCADHFQSFVSDPGYVTSPYFLLSEDGLHPNAAGYSLMARTWSEQLEKVY